MKKDYRYKLSRKSSVITLIVLVAVIGFLVYLNYYSASGFFPAWLTSLVITILLLYILSIPRFVRVTEEALEIHCLVELTKIKLIDIKSVKKIEKRNMRYSFPILGSYGFFGYYGYYYNFAEMGLQKVYASKWDNFVRINTIYEETYIINCDDPDELIHLIAKNKTA